MTSGSSTTQHADDCGWHVDQYPFECTCGAIPRKAIMDELIADSAEEMVIVPVEPGTPVEAVYWTGTFQELQEMFRHERELERLRIVKWLRETIFNCELSDIPSAIEAEEHLK